MEWVETTGKSIEEALSAALDLLGVDESDAEFEVIEEPKSGIFGRTKREARIRARLKPSIPRSKENRRTRKRRERPERPERQPRRAEASNGDAPARVEREVPSHDTSVERNTRRAPVKVVAEEFEVEQYEEAVPLVDQAGAAQAFLAGLMREFQVPGQVEVQAMEEDHIAVAVTGDANFGLLIGPKGLVMGSVQELVRAAVQNKFRRANARVFVDIGGFREKRRASLERFSVSVAETVKSTGKPQVLEPMNAADRKVVHDTMAEIEGVETRSEGAEPRRYVVVSPAGDSTERD